MTDDKTKQNEMHLAGPTIGDAASVEPVLEPLFFVRPAPGTAGVELADSIADGIIALINAERAAKGLPPLLKD